MAVDISRFPNPSVPVTVVLRAKGGLTIPQWVREHLHLKEGDQVMVSVHDGNIVLTPAAVIPREDAWFWTPEWQAGEREADEEIARGEGTFYASGEEFLKALDSRRT